MTGFKAPSTLTLALAVLIGASAAAAGATAMTMLAMPRDYTERMEVVQRSLDYAERVASKSEGGVYGRQAVCNRPLVAASVGLTQELRTRAQSSGLKVVALNVGAGAAPDATARLAPLDVSFTLEGSYDSAVRMTALLESTKPAVFLDSYELRRRPTGAVLKVTGRAFCWTSARL